MNKDTFSLILLTTKSRSPSLSRSPSAVAPETPFFVEIHSPDLSSNSKFLTPLYI